MDNDTFSFNSNLKEFNSQAQSSKVVHPGYQYNKLNDYCQMLRVRDLQLSAETGFSKSYLNRIRLEQIKIIDDTKVKLVKALNKISNNLFMVEDIFPTAPPIVPADKYSAELKGEQHGGVKSPPEPVKENG